MANLKPDDILEGKYRIEVLLNRGGFGRVWLAHDTLLDRMVAVKELIEVDEKRIGTFLAEMQIVANLDHEHIIKVHQALPVEETIFLVMEYCHDGSLRDALTREGRLPLEQVIAIGIQVCQGLAQAQGNGIVHHDIKPDNLMVGNDGRIKISDFGIANTTGGTLYYMAPELFDSNADPDDPRSDLYSVGITLFELLTGDVPFKGSKAQIINAHLFDHPAFPAELPGWMIEIIRKALSKHPDLRFQTAEEFATALAERQSPPLLKPDMLTASLWNAEAEKLMKKQKWWKARLSLEESLRLFPDFVIAHANIGVCLCKMGDSEKAYDHLVTGRRHQQPDVIKCYAGLLIGQKEYGPAISMLSEYTYRNPLDYEAHGLLSWAFYEAGHYEHCIDLLETVTKKHKDTAFLCNIMIAEYLLTGRTSKKACLSPFFNYNKEIISERPTSSDNLKPKLLFAPFNHKILESDVQLSNADMGINFSSTKQIVTIGKLDGNDFVIGESLISRRHCAIVREDENKWLLVDLGSTNGTSVDGRPIKRKYLVAGTYDLTLAGFKFGLRLKDY